ncbi:hypothetical isochorismatase hydrolase [Desulfosarcina widdelii]|uniref:Hypothetical isochorismatase hydrolase n=1 Tax=Desulfosarcina widdelii TaxID=947919 RepID=A0A5K7ZCV3_9BACT|nr:isochorismatase family cysteine hydrolase [Desulfosarcina widdelii]BBO76284.1 hypothetical isochorismatase hydrolase [Desulfosarcina widdelii]
MSTPFTDPFTAPQYHQAALITVDVQNDTLDGAPFEVPGTTAILPAIERLCRSFRDAGRPIVHVMRIYTPDGEDADRCRRSILRDGQSLFLKGSEGRRPADALLPDRDILIDDDLLMAGKIQKVGPEEVLIFKPRWGSFHRTPLEDHLKEKSVSTLVFCGCNYPNCPRTSIYQASEHDYRITVVVDAMSGIQARDIDELKNIGVNCAAVEDICELLMES